MARNKGYLVPATVKTLDDRDKYPVADVNDIAGSRHIVQSDADRFNTIPKLRRKLGMECIVVHTSGGVLTFKLFRLVNNPSSDITSVTDWEEIKTLSVSEFNNLVTSSSLTTILAQYAKIADLPDLAPYLKTTDAIATFAKKNDVYTKTESDTNFASKTAYDQTVTDLGKTVVDVVIPDIIKVNYNTDISAITLPDKVDVTFADGSTDKIDVTWDTTTYSKIVSGLQILLGSLTLPAGTKNAIVNVGQFIIVGTEIHEIASIDGTTPIPITAAYNTAFNDLPLPTRLKVNYTDGTTGFLDVDWSAASSTYGPTTLTTQTLTGTFILPQNVIQPSVPIQPTAKVAARVKPLEIVSDAQITIPTIITGTLFENAGIPTSNTVTLENGTTTTLDIKWNTAGYNPFMIGKQFITGEYILTPNVLNTASVYPKAVIEIGTMPDICEVIDPPLIQIGMGVPIGSLVLPSTVDIRLLAYDGTISNSTASVNWDTANSNYDSSKVGEYYITGDVVTPAGVTNMTDIGAEITVKVVAGTTYNISSVQKLTQSLANGATAANVTTPSTVTVNIDGTDGSTTTDTVSVAWTPDPNFDGTKAGTYTWLGNITLNIGVTTPDYTNNGNLKAKIEVTVADPIVTTTYSIQSIAHAGSTSVTEGDPLTNIDAVIPQQVSVTVLGSDGSTQTYNNVDVTWDYSSISTDGTNVAITGAARNVEIDGQLVLNSITDKVVANPSMLTAKYTVNIAVQTVVPTRLIVRSVNTTIPNISCNYGDPVTVVNNTLAAYPTVNVTLSDGTGISGVPVTWDTSSYDGTMASSNQVMYGNLNGTYLNGLTPPVYNDSNIRASVTVNVGAAPVVKTLDSYVTPSSVTVDNGTAEGAIPFPLSIIANVTEGGISNTKSLPITGWTFSTANTASAYDGTVAGNYLFTPTIDKSTIAGYTGNPVVPDLTVIVKDPIVSPVTYSTYEATMGSNLADNIGMNQFNNEAFTKLSNIASTGSDALENALYGIDNGSGDVDISTRTVEIRYLGTPSKQIPSPGIRVPLDGEDESSLTAFQNKLVTLGITDGAFGSTESPICVVALNIVQPASGSTADIDSAKSVSYIQFNQQTSNAKIMIRISDSGAYFPTPDQNNPY